MELKSYQQAVIKDLALYLEYLKASKGNYALAFEQFWAKHTDFARIEVYKNNLKNCPHICIKVPTAGGKTFIACNAVHTLVEGLQIVQERAVVWLVPSNAILEQTYHNLNNPKHFYRQKLNALFHHKVAVYKVDDLLNATNFNQSTVRENLSIFVLSYQSIRADKQTKENRRIYKENGNLQGFFSGLEDKSFLFQGEEVDEISLINVIRKLNPICIIDEAHNATSDLSIEMLHNINPSFVLELTATPRKDKKDKPISNIISYIDSFELKKENMVKLPLLVHNLKEKQEVGLLPCKKNWKAEQAKARITFAR
jgi:type III restriction enzyme